MKFEWQSRKIGDVVDIRRGASPRPIHKFLANVGMPWVKIADATSDPSRYLWKTNEYIIDEGINKSVVVEPETLIVSNSATPGLPKIMKIRACVHDGWLVFANYRGITRDFLYYKFIDIRRKLVNQANGSVFQNLKTDIVKDFDIDIPSIRTQNRIVDILSKLDEKIELNSAINNNLEQQAQAIFKSWFIDFEPFSNRKPREWSVSTLGDVSIMGAGGDKPQNVSTIKTDLYEYPIYSNGLSNEGLYGFTDKPKISEESVTVSARGTIGFVFLRHIPYVPIVRLVTLIPNTEIISAKYLYLWLKQLHITGTGTTQQQLTVPDFQKTEILVPSQEIVALFTATVEPIFEKIWANQNENEKLSSLRDTLLPKLMSGELDVSDIEL